MVGAGSVQNLRWCECCADEESDAYGFTSWKIVHRISQVRVCHIHGDPLLSMCRVCGTAIG
ncbi:TniQ family protein [Comamonas sp.]|uniref:TniQ family protein n=1 Tax=Comamonas sp. TaxID=34028 RepID=UPI00345B5D6E